MKIRVLTASLAFGLIAVANAETPNIQPGLWEYQTTMTVEAAFPFPDQNETTTECVTAEDIADSSTFLGDMEMEE